jgi:molybdate transport system substrate-binding protein
VTTLLRVLSAGAAKGLVTTLARALEREGAMRIDAKFDAAGAIRSAFEAEGADVVILPAPMLDALAADGLVDRESIATVVEVATGIAVREGDAVPRVDDAASLRDALAAAAALYCPDIVRATAGIHFLRVLGALGLEATSRSKLRAYPNGAAAMAALAREGPPGALGCTQVTEIAYTPGVTLVAPLPAPFELSTRYALAIGARASASEAARVFAARLTLESAS